MSARSLRSNEAKQARLRSQDVDEHDKSLATYLWAR